MIQEEQGLDVKVTLKEEEDSPQNLDLSPEKVLPEPHLFKQLVGFVARAFYEPRLALILNLLGSVNSLRNEKIAEYLHIPHAKDCNKLCTRLKQEGLLRLEQRPELTGPEGRQRRVPRNFWHIDYKLFINVVKWKIYKIGKAIEKEDEDKVAAMPYKCTGCGKEFNALDFAFLEKTVDMVPLCDVCTREIEVDDNVIKSNGLSEKFINFMNECKPIVDLLKLIDKLDIPDWISDATLPSEPKEQLEHKDVTFSVKSANYKPKPVIVEFQDTAEKLNTMDGADNDTVLAEKANAATGKSTTESVKEEGKADVKSEQTNIDEKTDATEVKTEEIKKEEEEMPSKEPEVIDDIAAYYANLSEQSKKREREDDDEVIVGGGIPDADDDDDEFEEAPHSSVQVKQPKLEETNDDDDEFEEV